MITAIVDGSLPWALLVGLQAIRLFIYPVWMKSVYRFRTTVFLSIFFLSACSQSRPAGENAIPVNLMAIEEPSLSEFFGGIEVIPLENKDSAYLNPSCMFAYMKVGDKFYIKDKANSSIVVFNEDGGWEETFKRYGRGPEEYVMLTDMAYNEGMRSLDILEATGTIISYDLEPPHRMIRRIKIPDLTAIHYFLPFGSGYYLFSMYGDQTLNYLDVETGVLTAVPGVPETEQSARAGYNTSVNPFFCLDGLAYYVDGASGDFFRLEENRAVPFRSWDMGRYTFRPDKVRAEASGPPSLERINAMSNSMAGPFYRTRETGRYVFSQFLFMKRNLNVILDKETGKTHVFSKMKEGITFIPGPFCGDALYFLCPPERAGQVLPDGFSVPDDDSNYLIIKYLL